LKRVTPKGTVPRIRSERGMLSDLLASGGSVLASAIEALDRVNRVLSEDNIKRISGMLDDVQAATAELRERKAIIADAQRALQSADRAARQIGELAASSNALVKGDGRQIVARLGNAATDLEAAAKDLRTMMGKLEGPTGNFATTGLQQITSASASLQQAADSFDRILGEMQQSPQGLVNKPPAQEIEVEP
jgi:phospholipid/cholesterol/gamma-HCH transport system substrate-binding protein